MKSNFDKQLKIYLQEISGNLPRNYPEKKKLLLSLEKNIRNFLDEHPSADWSDILEQFGTASEVTESYLEELSDSELALSFQKRKKFTLIIVLLSVILMILLTVSILHFIVLWQENTLIVEETLYVFDETEFSTEW